MPSIAVIGASADRSKFGNICVRAYADSGYDVFPVHYKEEIIENLPVYRSVSDIPEKLDRVSLYLTPSNALEMLDIIADLDVGEVWLNPGVDVPAVVEKAHDLGLNAVVGCSISDLGLSPAEYSKN